MENVSASIEDIARGIHRCLGDLGIEADLQVSTHEGVVAALVQSEERTLRVVAHVSDRDTQPFANGTVRFEAARAEASAAVSHPTLEGRSASGSTSGPAAAKTGVTNEEQA